MWPEPAARSGPDLEYQSCHHSTQQKLRRYLTVTCCTTAARCSPSSGSVRIRPFTSTSLRNLWAKDFWARSFKSSTLESSGSDRVLLQPLGTDTFTCIIGNAQNGNYIQRVVKTHALHLEPYVPESNWVWQFSCTTVLGQPNSKNDRLICVSFMVSNVWCVRTTSWVLSQFHNMSIYTSYTWMVMGQVCPKAWSSLHSTWLILTIYKEYKACWGIIECTGEM
jgi:hypothetical protein